MKVRVVRKFLDVHTKKVHRPGEELEISEKRFGEIQKAGSFVVPVKEESAEVKAELAAKQLEKRKKED